MDRNVYRSRYYAALEMAASVKTQTGMTTEEFFNETLYRNEYHNKILRTSDEVCCGAPMESERRCDYCGTKYFVDNHNDFLEYI